ncbi:MAG: DUF4252 domain-containing protein [Muribaculaceae bacterium]|nr:DUF4252 domain-containing protein [Muribaculaceae bacterium]
MKKLGCVILFLATMLSAFANDVVKDMDMFVQDYRNHMYISYVYVSKSMMDMVDSRKTLSQINGINGNALRGKLSTIQIISVNNTPQSKALLSTAITDSMSDGFEKLLRVEGYDESTEIYFRKEVKSKRESSPATLVLISEAGGKYKVIIFTGTFTLDDVVKTMERKKRLSLLPSVDNNMHFPEVIAYIYPKEDCRF